MDMVTTMDGADPTAAHGRASTATTIRQPSWIHPSAVSFYESPEVRRAQRCKTRRGVINLALDAAWKKHRQVKRTSWLWLEFGVWTGDDITHIASVLRKKHAALPGAHNDKFGARPSHATPVVHGFDSFQGLPEEWKQGLFPKGAFDLRGVPPTLYGSNIILHKGWFDETVEVFLDGAAATQQCPETATKSTKSSKSSKSELTPACAFIHADADLYSSTATFLRALFDRGFIVKGTVVVFDEYTNHAGWEDGEYQAWLECCELYGCDFQYICVHVPRDEASVDFKHGYQSVGIRVTDVKNRKQRTDQASCGLWSIMHEDCM